MADQRRAIDAFLQRAHLRRQAFGQHRHHPIGEIDAVAAPPRLAVEARSGADVERHVGDRDDRLPPAVIGWVVIGCGPHRIVMVARIGRIDRDDRQMAEVFAFVPQRQRRHTHRFLQRLRREHVGNPQLVDRDQREAARRERVAQHLRHAHGDARRAPGFFGQHQIADLRCARIGHLEFAAFLLLHPLQPQRRALLPQHAEHEFLALGQRLHRVRDPALARFLGARKDAVAHTQRALLALAHAQLWRGRFGLPAFGHGPGGAAIVDIGNAQHRHLGQAAKFVEGAAGGAVDQPLIGHVLQQRLQQDLVLRGQPEGARNLALARRGRRGGDEIEDLLAGRQAGRALYRFGHRPSDTPHAAKRQRARHPAG